MASLTSDGLKLSASSSGENYATWIVYRDAVPVVPVGAWIYCIEIANRRIKPSYGEWAVFMYDSSSENSYINYPLDGNGFDYDSGLIWRVG